MSQSEKVVCPFDSVHVVDRHKLIYHLGRCVKTYRGGHNTQVHCPLDYSHVVEAGELENHVRNCPQLALAAPLFQLESDPSVITGNLRLPPPPPGIERLVTGEWDNSDADVPSHYGNDDFPSAFSDAASTTVSTVTVGFGRGRGYGGGGGLNPAAPASGYGRGRGGGGVGVRGAAATVADEYRPGDPVPGGYVLRDIYYPPGFGPRGRFEQRGCI